MTTIIANAKGIGYPHQFCRVVIDENLSVSDLKPGDYYVGKRNTGWYLSRVGCVDTKNGWIESDPPLCIYSYDLHECRVVVKVHGDDIKLVEKDFKKSEDHNLIFAELKIRRICSDDVIAYRAFEGRNPEVTNHPRFGDLPLAETDADKSKYLGAFMGPMLIGACALDSSDDNTYTLVDNDYCSDTNLNRLLYNIATASMHAKTTTPSPKPANHSQDEGFEINVGTMVKLDRTIKMEDGVVRYIYHCVDLDDSEFLIFITNFYIHGLQGMESITGSGFRLLESDRLYRKAVGDTDEKPFVYYYNNVTVIQYK